MGASNPIEHHIIVHERASPNPTWNQEYVGVSHLVERKIDRKTQEPIVGSNRSLAMPDETNLRPGKALKHFIRPHRIQRGYLLK